MRVVLDTNTAVSALLFPAGRLSSMATAWMAGRISDDVPFVELAWIGRAEVLVTGDAALLKLVGRTPFSIETPRAFRTRLESR